MKAILLSVAVLSTGLFAQAQEIEASCRIKAKEIAADTYRSCVTEQKNAQIEQIKKDYANKLQNLKSHYEQELKKLNNPKTKAEDSSSEAAPIEKIDSAARPAPKKQKVAVMPKKTAKKTIASSNATSSTSNVNGVTEMTVHLKQSPGVLMNDDSMMDIPEPIPVEDVPTESSAI